MSENSKTIRFISSDYKELFRIPDGGNIRVVYPPGDGRGIQTRKCDYVDETHTRIGGNVYHICEFAEVMERLGAKYEPEVQIRGTEILPFVAGEEKFYTYNREEGNTCIGHYAGEFGSSGDRYFSEWRGRENDRNTPEFQTELHSAIYALRQNALKDYDTMSAYCESHPEAKLDSGDTYKRYGFKLETDTRQYYVSCFFGEYKNDTRFMVYAYDKPAPVLEQAQPAFGTILPGTADDYKMFYSDIGDNSLSVGYLSGDFGKDGSNFDYNWFDGNNEMNTSEFKTEFKGVMETLQQNILKDFKSSESYCYKHPEAQLKDWGEGHHYGFKLETTTRRYFIRCTTYINDSFCVFAYNKEAVREQERHADDKASVLKQIRDAKKTPKPPRKKKTPDKQKGGTEI